MTGANPRRAIIRAMEYGMPPIGSLGVGVDRFAMVLAGVATIRETILFLLTCGNGR